MRKRYVIAVALFAGITLFATGQDKPQEAIDAFDEAFLNQDGDGIAAYIYGPVIWLMVHRGNVHQTNTLSAEEAAERLAAISNSLRPERKPHSGRREDHVTRSYSYASGNVLQGLDITFVWLPPADDAYWTPHRVDRPEYAVYEIIHHYGH